LPVAGGDLAAPPSYAETVQHISTDVTPTAPPAWNPQPPPDIHVLPDVRSITPRLPVSTPPLHQPAQVHGPPRTSNQSQCCFLRNRKVSGFVVFFIILGIGLGTGFNLLYK